MSGLREVKRAETERRLASTAYDLARSHGLAAVTVDDIVLKAHVSRRTFSNYFACKEEAIAAVLVHAAEDGLASWQPDPVGDSSFVPLIRGLVQHQAAAGVLGLLVEVAHLATAERQLVPYVREAQWRLWALAGERVVTAGGAGDSRRRAELDAVLGAVFGVVSAALTRASAVGADLPAIRGEGDTNPAAAPKDLRATIDHVLDRLAAGL